MKRREMLLSLAGLAVTPAIATRMLPHTLPRLRLLIEEALRRAAPLHLEPVPMVYGIHPVEGGYLVPPEFRADLIAMLRSTAVVREESCR
jgi:hypothetical protein